MPFERPTAMTDWATAMNRLQYWEKKFRLKILLLIAFVLSTGLMPWLSAFAADAMSDSAKHQRVMAMYADYRKDFAGVEEIDASAAIELVGNPEAVFVDVRSPEEQAVSMIPGAITSEVFLADPDRFRGQRIIAYCTISFRSGKLAAKMGRRGITIVNLKGGLLAWAHAGGALVRGYKQVKQLHVYGRKWDLAPSDIETVY